METVADADRVMSEADRTLMSLMSGRDLTTIMNEEREVLQEIALLQAKIRTSSAELDGMIMPEGTPSSATSADGAATSGRDLAFDERNLDDWAFGDSTGQSDRPLQEEEDFEDRFEDGFEDEDEEEFEFDARVADQQRRDFALSRDLPTDATWDDISAFDDAQRAAQKTDRR
jgi:hypothetical protein